VGRKRTGRYSGYIRPFSLIVDLIIINLMAFYFLPSSLNDLSYHLFIAGAWVIISLNVGFYEVYRYTKILEIYGKILQQYFLFLIVDFAYLGYFSESIDSVLLFKVVTGSLILVALAKLFIYYFLRRFRVVFGGNFRTVVIVGSGKSVEHLVKFFNENPDYGYKLIKVFEVGNDSRLVVDEACKYVLDNKIDEMYCSLEDLTTEDVNKFIDFTDNNLKILKFLPDNKEFFSRNLTYQYYGYIPILSLRNIPLDQTTNKVIKRTFDLIFSLIVIVAILSWLTPILAILIRMELKGPTIIKHKRNGLNYKEF